MAILCCLCGVSIQPNDMNMCTSCIAGEVDIKEGITTDCEVTQCRKCLRFQPRGKASTGSNTSVSSGPWLTCELESAELMAVCLKSIHGLNKVKLIDANFIWTEPHSKRIKVRLTLQKETMQHALVRNDCVVTFVILNATCPDCTKHYHNNTWHALVQIRQKAVHKRTFLKLEQLMLQHDAHVNAISIQSGKDGMDFYFATKNEAEKFLNFMQSHVPLRSKTSTKLISENVHNATANMQTTFCVELVPICKHDFIILPKKFSKQLGSISRYVLCARTTALLHLVDPLTGRETEISSDKYFKTTQSKPFTAQLTASQLTDFMVLNVEPVDNAKSHGHGHESGKYILADVEVARVRDLGRNDQIFLVRTHLGRILHAGDIVHGYDLTNVQFGTNAVYDVREDEMPEIVLVRKGGSVDAVHQTKKNLSKKKRPTSRKEKRAVLHNSNTKEQQQQQVQTATSEWKENFIEEEFVEEFDEDDVVYEEAKQE